MILLLELGREEVHGPSLAKNQSLLRVALEGDPLDLLVLEAKSVHLLIDETSRNL